MPFENATRIPELNPAYPLGSDPVGEGDNHIRSIKKCLQAFYDGSFLRSDEREYAAIGFQVMPGSFEQGGVLQTASSVLLEESTGRYFSGAGPFPQTVTAGTVPNVPPFINRTKVLFGMATTTQLALGGFEPGSRVFVSNRDNGLFNVVLGGVANGIDILNAGNGNTAVIDKGQIIYAEMLGVIAGDFSAANTTAVVNAITFSGQAKVPIHFKRARYPGWNFVLAASGATIKGAGMPAVSSDRTRLVDGSGTIFDGRIMFIGNDLTLLDFGVDIGSGSVSNMNVDGLVVFGNAGSTPSDSVTNHDYRNIIALLHDSSTAFHGILLQGIRGLTFDNLNTVYGLYGTVIKCQDVRGGRVYGQLHAGVSCYIKGDIGSIAGGTYGVVDNVSINEVHYEGDGVDNLTVACMISGNTAPANGVHIGLVKATKGGYALSVHSTDSSTQLVDVSVGEVHGYNNYEDVVIQGLNPNAIYGVNIGQITTYNPRRGVIFEVRTEHSSVVTVGSITGTNSGPKEISDLDIVLRGLIHIGLVNVASTNARPTISTTSLKTQVVLNSNMLLDFENVVTLQNGFTHYPSDSLRLVHDSTGYRFSGRVQGAAATATTICTLPGKLASRSKMFPVACVVSPGGYTTCIVYIENMTVSVLAPLQSTITWMDLSSVFVEYSHSLL